VADLRPYLEEEDELPSLRTNSFHTGEDDGDQVQDKTTRTEAQGPRKELDVVLAAHEQPTTSRTWPVFVTLVS